MEYINRFITRFLRIVRYYRWKINVRFTSPIPCSGKEKITVIVPSYNILRVHNLEHLIRSVLRYNGVEKVIVSNHNPLIRLENHIHLKDERITLINQEERRGCGYAWVVASQQTADYFLIIDDDFLILPKQVAILSEQLFSQPEIPHGLTGKTADGRYVESEEDVVDNLYNIYAVTRKHVETYLIYTREIVTKGYATIEDIDYWADDVIISRVGTSAPRTHAVGFITHCRTSDRPGVATWKEEGFDQRRLKVQAAVETIKAS